MNQKAGCLSNQETTSKGCPSIQFLLRGFCKDLRLGAAIHEAAIQEAAIQEAVIQEAAIQEAVLQEAAIQEAA